MKSKEKKENLLSNRKKKSRETPYGKKVFQKRMSINYVIENV